MWNVLRPLVLRLVSLEIQLVLVVVVNSNNLWHLQQNNLNPAVFTRSLLQIYRFKL